MIRLKGGIKLNFLTKLDLLMSREGLNKHTLSERSGIPYTTIMGWYKKGYGKAKLSSVQMIADFFDVALDYLLRDDISDPMYGKPIDNPSDPILPLSSQEIEHLKKHRDLTMKSQITVLDLIDHLYGLEFQPVVSDEKPDKIPSVTYIQFAVSDQKAAAGNGIYLGPESFTVHMVDKSKLPHGAAFGVPISGDSMEPKYFEGDIAVVSKEYPEAGQVGLFTLDGNGYIKVLGNGELLSLNTKYDPIPLPEEYISNGTVVGKISWDDVRED